MTSRKIFDSSTIAVPVKPEVDGLGGNFRRPIVMVVDDEPAVLDLLKEYLEGEDYDVRTYSNGQDALRAVVKDRPQVVMVDLQMPDMHGLELIAMGREAWPDAVYVVITAHTTFDSLMEAMRGGVHDYLTKPFSSADTVKLVVGNAVEKQVLESASRMQATVTGTLLKLGEISCVGETRDEFFALVGALFTRVLDATTAAAMYKNPQRLRCHVQTRFHLTPGATEQLQNVARERLSVTEGLQTLELSFDRPSAEMTAPVIDQFETLLALSVIGVDGVEAQYVVAHRRPEAFSKHAVEMALSFARNVSIIVQRHFMGASHEHQMIVDLLHHLRDGVVVVDKDFVVRYVNPQARKVLGLRADSPAQTALEALGNMDKSLVAARTPRSFLAALQKQVSVNLDGVQLFLDVQAYTFYTPTKVAYRMILFRDVTHLRRERSRIEALNRRLQELNDELMERNSRLEAANKELDSFAYIASHDLQEPFRHIEIFVQFLERDLASVGEMPGETDYLLGQISKNVEIAKRILSDLRTLSRITRMRNPHRRVKLLDLVEEVLERFGDSLADAKVQVTVNELPEARCDPIKMRELFHNLISNAIKYKADENPTIEIGAENREEANLVYVQDNGIGIEKEYHEYIFQACRRIPHKEEVKGSGLGLAIVKKIVDEHGGTVKVRSELGEGARFEVLIPKSV